MILRNNNKNIIEIKKNINVIFFCIHYKNKDRYLFLKKKEKKICENRLRTIFLKKKYIIEKFLTCEKNINLISFHISFQIHNLIFFLSYSLHYKHFFLRYFSETKSVE